MTLAKIVYATMTGNTEEISEIIEGALLKAGVTVEREEVSETDVDFFDDGDICIVATYTYGEGDLPFECEDFFDELADKDLSNKIYGVVGSGDKEYGEFYCQSARDFDEQFSKTKALKGSDVVQIENNPEEEDIVALNQFVQELLSKI